MGALDFALHSARLFISDNINVELEKQAFNTLWVTMQPNTINNSYNFSLPLLHALKELTQTIKNNHGNWVDGNEHVPVHYAVMKSAHPDYFNLGGDLNYFRNCIRERDKNSLHLYSKLCLDIMYDWSTSTATSMTTIALVQGRALGGGFEAALSADYLIAEEQSTFGFPEIMFGLFPCTGGMSLLARRIGIHKAEQMLTTPRIYSATELFGLGLIDEICPQGEGTVTAEKFIRMHSKKRSARMALQRAKQRMAALDYSELTKVVEEWVELAMQLSEEELRVMDMLIMMQKSPRPTTNS